MKTIRSFKRHLWKGATAIVIFALLTTCNAVNAGLGPKVDITAPKVSITSPATNGTYQKGTLHLVGTASDDIGVASINVTYPTSAGDTTKTATLTGTDWTLDIPSNTPSGLPEGSNTINVSVADSSGKTSSASVLVYVDNIAPTVLVTYPLMRGPTTPPQFSSTLDIKGEVYDSSPITNVVVTLYDDATGNPLASQTNNSNPKQADGTNTWSTRFFLKTQTTPPATGFFGPSDDGKTYRYKVVATDAAGNVNTYYYFSNDIYSVKVTGAPFPTVNEIGQLDNAGTGSSTSITSFTDLKNLRLGDGAVSTNADFKFANVSLVTISFSNLNSTPPTPTTNTLGLNSVITGTFLPPANSSGAIDTSSIKAEVFKTTTPPIPSTTINAGNGDVLISYGDTNLDTLTIGNSIGFTIKLPLATFPPGQYYLRLRADANGSDTMTTALAPVVPFFIDSGAPTLTETTITGLTPYKNAAFTFGGTATAALGLDRIEVLESKDGGANVGPTNVALSGTSTSWTSGNFPTTLSDGTYSYELKLVTSSGTSTTLYRSVVYDTTNPTVSINNLSNLYSTNVVNGSVTANFGVSDVNGISSTRWWVVPAASPAPTWTSTSSSPISLPVSISSPPYNGTFDSTLFPEGNYVLYVKSQDKAGNIGSTSMAIVIDQSAPNLNLVGAPATINASTAASFTGLTGQVWDTNSLGPVTLDYSYTKNGGAATTGTITYTLSGTPYASPGSTWTLPFTVDTSASHSTDGQYVFTVNATDASGRKTTVTHNLTIDTKPPTIAVNMPVVSSWSVGGTITVSGTSNDGSGTGVSTVYYKVDDASIDHSADSVASWTAASGTGVWSSSPTVSSEGNKTLWVKAIDAAGNVNTSAEAIAAKVNFGIDNAPPNLTEGTAASTTVNAAGAAGFTGFSGTIWDSNPAALATLSYSYTKNGGSATTGSVSYTQSGTPYASPGNTWTWLPFTINAVTHAQDGIYAFTITATDVAGKSTSVTRNLTVDTQPPVVTVTSPAASSWTSSTTLSTTGISNDGTGTGTSSVYVIADDASVAHDNDASTAGWTLATGTVSWSASLTLSGEGNKTLWVLAIDPAGNKTTSAQALAGKVNFGLDLFPPVLTYTDSIPSITRTAFSLTGTATDTNPAGAATLDVAVDGGATQAVTVTSGNWTFPGTASLPTDGVHTYVFTAKDVAGKVTSSTRTITVDTTPPTASITNPVNLANSVPAYWLSGSTATFNGPASDTGTGASGISAVYFLVDTKGNSHAADANIPGTWSQAAGTTNWSTTVSLSTEGEFTLWVAAVDNAGNVQTPVSRNFGVDQSAPTLTESHASTFSSKVLFNLSGSITDSNALASLKVTESKNGGAAATIYNPAETGTSQAWTSPSLPFGVGSIDTAGHTNDGSYAYVLTATDVAGKTYQINRTVTIDTAPPSVTLNTIPSWISGSAYAFSGTASDPGSGASGIASIQYSFDNSTWNTAIWSDTSGGANTAGTWSVTVNLGTLGEGNKQIWVKALDAAANVDVLAPVAFGVDQNPPNLTANTPASVINATTAAAFTGFSGTIWDTNTAALASLTYSYTKNGGSATTGTITYSASGTPYSTPGNTWSWSPFTIDTVTNSNDGIYVFTVTATDISGKVTALTRNFTIDTLAPVISVTSPSASSWVSSTSVTITGTSSDGAGTGVSAMQYSTDNVTFSAASGTATSWNVPLTGLSEGNKTYYLRAQDTAGNVSTVQSLSFGVDLNPPALTETSINTSAQVIKSSDFTLAGNVSDTNSLTSLSITATKNGTSQGTVFSQASAGAYTYTKTVSSSGTDDGLWVYTMTATDIAGKTTVLTRNVYIDATNPTTPVINALGSTYFSNSLPVSGTASDSGSGLQVVNYKIDALSWTALTGTDTWYKTIDISALSEGVHTLSVQSIDRANNVSTIVNQSFTIDRNDPTITETVYTGTVYKKTTFQINVDLADTLGLATNALSTPTLTVNGTAQTLPAAPVKNSDTGTAQNWTVTVPTSFGEGSYVLTFNAQDAVGRNATAITRTVIVDASAPALTVSAPNASSWINTASYTVRGVADDGNGSGVSQVWTLVDAAGNNHATDTQATVTSGTTWKLATGTVSWSYTWNVGAEGNKTLWVASLDNAGNWSTSYTQLSFGYDQTSPTVAANALSAYSTGFTVTGTSSDNQSVSSVQLKIDSGSYSTATGTSTWSFNVATATVTALSEGPHTVTVLATDAAGNSTTTIGNFNKDTTAPTVSYNNISSGGGTVVQDPSPILTGNFLDASGISQISYLVQWYNPSMATWSTLPSFDGTASPVGGSPTSYNWSVNLTGQVDGKYRIVLSATDVSTPANTLTTPSVTFLLSKTNPSATISTPAMGTYQKGAFSVTGTLSDPNVVTGIVGKVASTSVDFSSGTTTGYASLDVNNLNLGSGTFTTNQPHGLTAGDTVYFVGTLLPGTASGLLNTSTAYFVKTAPTSTTFTVSATNGGAALVFTTNGSNFQVAGPKIPFAPQLPTTVTASSATVTSVGHGLAVDNIVYFNFTTAPQIAGIDVQASVPYYVVSVPTSDTLTLSATKGGSAVTFSSTGSAVSLYSPNRSIKYLIPSLPVSFSDGPLTAWVQITAGSSKSTVTSRDFTLDTTGPTVALSSPTSGTRSVGNLTLIGTTDDTGSVPSGVVGTILYQIGKNYNLGNAGSWSNANVSGGSYSWSISLGDMSAYANVTYSTECDSSGNPQSGTNLWKLPIVFQATDKAGNVTQKTDYYLILDPNGNVPVVNITQPANGLTFGGQQRITGTASQPTWVHDVEVLVDPTNTGTFPSVPAATLVPGTGVFTTSSAHGLTANTAVYIKGDTQPQIGGVAVNSKTPYYVVGGSLTSTTFQVSATSGGSAVTFSANGTNLRVDQWQPATLNTTGNNIIWYYDINVGSIYPQSGNSQTISVQVRAWNSPTAGGTRGTISGTLTTPLSMTFNNTFPKIQNIQVNGQSYYSQITTKGQFVVTSTVSSSKGIAKIERVESSPLSGSTTLYDNTGGSFGSTSTVVPPTSYSAGSFPNGSSYKLIITSLGTTDWQAIGAPAGAVVGTVFAPTGAGSGSGTAQASDASGDFTYSVSLTIDSTTLYNNTTGVYAFDLRATDMGVPAQVSSSSVVLNEDNFYSTSTLSHPVSETLTGTSFKVQGSATDVGSGSGTIGGLSKVVVYVTDSTGSNVLDIKTGGSSVAAGTLTAKDMNNSGTVGTVAYPNTASYSNYFASIDSLGEIGLSDSNGDGLIESFTINGNARDWWVQLDTTKLTDGPVQVHYVIWDLAGNATHYMTTASVSNNAPVLGSIDLGTDVNGDGSIAVGETTNFLANANFAATNFNVRNNMLSFKVNLSKGSNFPIYYSVKYSGVEQNGTLTSNTVTINNFSSIPDSSGTNDRTFTIYVYDSTAGGGANSQSFTQTVSLTIQNKDAIAPTINIAPFGTVYSSSSSDSSKSLGLVSSYNSNVVVSGSTLLGHVEYGSVNPYRVVTSVNATSMVAGTIYTILTLGTSDFTLAGASSNSVGTSFIATGSTTGTGTVANINASPALSGQVIFRGKAYDNQRISRITATIPNFDGGAGAGVEFDLATWSGSGLTAASNNGNWSFALDSSSESVTQSNGHVLNWNMTWDSSKISTVSATNVNVVFKTYDFWTTGTGATRSTATTLTSTGINGMAIAAGTPVWVGTTLGTWSSGTWTTTVGSQSGNTITLSATISTGNQAFVVSNTPSSQTLSVDVVPYVTKVTSALSSAYSSNPSAINRSALGTYPIRESENLTLTGFNFNGTSTTVAINGTSITPSAGSTSSLTLPVGTTATSGALTLSVNSVNMANNLNNNSMSWNKAANGLNNNLLNDNISFYIWKLSTVLSSTSVRYPRMRVSTDASQNVGFSYDSGAQELHVNDGGTDTKIDGSYTQFYDTGFAYDSNGKFYAIGMNGDSGGSGGTTGGNGAPYNTYANSGFYAWAAGNATADSTGAYTFGTNKVMIESAYNGTSFNSSRVQEPKIAAAATGTGNSLVNLYTTYWDDSQSVLKFRWGTVTGPSSVTFGGNLVNRGNSAPGSASGFQTIADTTTTSSKAGVFSAVGVTSGGVAVVAWYDATNQSLVYSYNTQPATTTIAATALVTGNAYTISTVGTTNFTLVGASSNTVGVTFVATGAGTGTGTVTSEAQWQAHATVIDSNFAGWYVDMAVDAADGIHLAYYGAADGDLKYAYIPAYNNAAAVSVSTVDSWLSTGSRISISVKLVSGNYVPYISYYMPAFTSTKYSIRTAWRTDFSAGQATSPAGVTSDLYTQKWEIMTVPTSTIPKDYTVGIGFKTIGSSTNSPVLGYATNSGLETAQLK